MNYIVCLFLLLFIGMWIFNNYMISRMGWADLIPHYEYNDAFIGKRIGIISASVNKANYNNALVLKYHEDGIYLRPVFLFRLFHKPVLIPWKEIKEVRDKKILFYTFKEMIVGQPFVAVISLNKSTFRKIESNLTTYASFK